MSRRKTHTSEHRMRGNKHSCTVVHQRDTTVLQTTFETALSTFPQVYEPWKQGFHNYLLYSVWCSYKQKIRDSFYL